MSYNISTVSAADGKVGVINVNKVITQTAAGIKALKVIDQRKKEMENKLTPERMELEELQNSIKKKRSMLSKEKLQKLNSELENKGRAFQNKMRAASAELKQFQDEEISPIIKLISEYGKKHKYALILESNTGIIYYDKAVDITDTLIKEVDKSMK